MQGIALSFVNYTQELPFFCDRVLPMLAKAGYRGVRRAIAAQVRFLSPPGERWLSAARR